VGIEPTLTRAMPTLVYMLPMADEERKADPTGGFGEGAADRPAEDASAAPYSRDTTQHFSPWRRAEAENVKEEGTATRVPLIDRPRSAR
jgi:hypothetical protein